MLLARQSRRERDDLAAARMAHIQNNCTADDGETTHLRLDSGGPKPRPHRRDRCKTADHLEVKISRAACIATRIVHTSQQHPHMGAVYSRSAHEVAIAQSGHDVKTMTSHAGLFALLVENSAIIVGILIVLAYCSAVFAGGYVVMYPVRQLFNYSWDVILASFVLLTLAGKLSKRLPSKKAVMEMPPAEQELAKKARKAAARAAAMRQYAALAVCVAVSVVRWQYGDVSTLLTQLKR